MGAFVELEGTIEDASGVGSFVLRILDPVKDTQTPYGDFFCRIHCPALLKRDFDIYGVDAEQARALALRYIRSRLKGTIVKDKRDRIVSV